MKFRFIALFPLFAAVAFGQYTWDYTKDPVVSDSTRWNTNGSPTFGSGGVTFSGSGESLISIPAIPIANPTTNLAEPGTSSSDYEVNTVLSLQYPGGGTFIHFLRTSADTVVSGSGSYISVELAIPTGFTSPGTAYLHINQCVSGTVTSLGGGTITATSGMTLRSVIYGPALYVFNNSVLIWAGGIPSTTGNPGIGGYSQPSGSGFVSVSLGHRDVLGPNQIPVTSIASSVFPTSVSLRWQGMADDPHGIGVWDYNIYRNGTYIDSTATPEFVDTTVVASTTYSYTVYALDFHQNYSAATTFNISTPPTGAIDPRRTGTYTTGSYWGGGGEQIDSLSGNLSFSIPLLSAQGRTGWTVPVGLVYNSQNWRQDSGVNWKLGNDVGFGYGWQMLIGSITPYYPNWWSGPDHFVYTDSTGSQYRLDTNNSGVWTSSTQSAYVWLDTTVSPYKLHFRDGTFWVMGSTSGGTEADAGTMYPTIIEDTFGNQAIATYDTGAGLPFSETSSPPAWTVTQNTSSRIISIEDARAVPCNTAPIEAVIPCSADSNSTVSYASYGFSYNRTSYAIPHLASYTNFIGTSESGSGFTYSAVTQEPPFGSDPHTTAPRLIFCRKRPWVRRALTNSGMMPPGRAN